MRIDSLHRNLERGAAVEACIGPQSFCFGAHPSLADIYLIPQLHAARRFAVPHDDYPRILRVEWPAAERLAFQTAHPDRQPDAPPG